MGGGRSTFLRIGPLQLVREVPHADKCGQYRPVYFIWTRHFPDQTKQPRHFSDPFPDDESLQVCLDCESQWMPKGILYAGKPLPVISDRNGVRPKDVLREYGIQRYDDERAHRALSTACFPFFGPPDSPENTESGSDLD